MVVWKNPSWRTHLFVLIGSDGDELGLREAVGQQSFFLVRVSMVDLDDV